MEFYKESQMHKSSDSTAEEGSLAGSVDPLTSVEKLNGLIAEIGMGKYQWYIFGLCGFGWIADNMWLQGLALVLDQVQKEFGINNSSSGLGTSATMFGMLFGALFWGVISDKIGRRPAFTLTLLIGSIFGTAAAFAPNFPIYCTFLGLMGFGVGGNLPIDSTLFLEFAPAVNQSLLAALAIFWPVGQLIASALSWALIPKYSCPLDAASCAWQDNMGWRYTLGGLGVLTFLMLVCRSFIFYLHESPKFLLSKNRRAEAIAVLNKIAEFNGKPTKFTVEDLGIDDINDISTHDESTIWERVQRLFSRKLMATTILVSFIYMFVVIGYTMFHGFLPKFLSLGTSSSTPLSFDETYRNYMIISIAGMPGPIISMYVMDTIVGRKGSLAFATFGTAILLYMFTIFKTSTDQLIISSFESLLSNVMYGVLYAYTPEVFPTYVRGTGVGFASACGRVTGVIAPILTGVLLNINIQVPLHVSASLILTAGLCVICLPYETRGKAAQ